MFFISSSKFISTKIKYREFSFADKGPKVQGLRRDPRSPSRLLHTFLLLREQKTTKKVCCY